eukprot:gene2103-2591_t
MKSSNTQQLQSIQRDIESYLESDETSDHSTTLLYEAQDTLKRQQEYIEQLESQLKFGDRLETEVLSLSDSVNSRDTELSSLKKKYYELERNNNFLRTKAVEAKLQLEEQEKSYERKIALKNKELDDIQSKIRTSLEFEASTQQKFQELEIRYNDLERNSQLKLKALEKERLKYRSDLVDLKHKNSSNDSFESMEKSKDSQIENLVNLNRQMENEISELKSKLQQAHTNLSASEQKIETLNLSILSTTSSSSTSDKKLQQKLDDTEKLIISLKNELNYYKDQNEKNSKLIVQLKTQTENLGNAEILKQQNEVLKDKLVRFDEIVAKYSNLQVEYKLVLDEKKKLDGLYGSVDKFNGPDQFIQKIVQLEKENQTLVGKVGELTANLKLSESRIDDLSNNIKEEKEINDNKDQKIKELNETIKRIEKLNYQFKREKDGMSRVLDAFNAEDAVNGNNDKDHSIKNERIKELEKSLSEKNILLEQYEFKLSSKNSNGSSTSSPIDINEYKDEIIKLNKEIERLLQDNAILESRLGRGEYDANKYKVLHMTVNPSTIAAEQNAPANGTPSDSDPKLIEENHRLQIQVNDNEKKMERLKQVFRQKINEFREAVYALLGFKIDVDSHSRYRLQSMYAEKEEDFLLFQMSGTGGRVGNMELLETDFTKTLENEIRDYLFKCKSIPSFLSQITIELFSRQTYHP